MLYNNAQHILAFFNSNHDVKLVLRFQVLHFPTLEIWSLIFQSCASVFDLLGPSLVLHFTVLHFQSTHTELSFVYLCFTVVATWN